jgi:Domain of unknown function (DUF927)
MTATGSMINKPASSNGHPKVTASFDYVDADGKVIYRTVRIEPGRDGRPKSFAFQRPGPRGGWIDGLGKGADEVKKVPYRLKQLLDSAQDGRSLNIPEGEAKADLLVSLGLVATTNPGGAQAWHQEWGIYFKDRDIVHWQDNDESGLKHRDAILKSVEPHARSFVSVLLPGLGEKGDVIDWMAHRLGLPNKKLVDWFNLPDELRRAAAGLKLELLEFVKKAKPIQLRATAEKPLPEPVFSSAAYFVKNGCTFHDRSTERGRIFVQLANFVAWITEQITFEDGLEVKHTLKIQGKLAGGKPLPEVEVSLSEFKESTWPIEKWGVDAVVEAGRSAPDHLRAAIQNLSKNAKRTRAFGHTGWRQEEGLWKFLHSGGAICADGFDESVRVDLPSTHVDYRFPAPPSGRALVEAIQASLRLIGLARAAVTFPVLCAVYRSLLGPANFSIWIEGQTQCGKTELATLAQQHMGSGWAADNLPGNWLSTGNAVEAARFIAKDVLYTIDDYVPVAGPLASQQKANLDRVIRGQANRSGRQRADKDGSLKAGRVPRGSTMSTGEDLPTRKSELARVVVVRMVKREFPLPNLTPFQKDACEGKYAAAMAGFIQWLAPKYTQILEGAKAELALHEKAFSSDGIHGREPRNLAELFRGFKWFIKFAVEKNAITAAEGEELENECLEGLLEAGRAKQKLVAAADPCEQSLELLNAAIRMGLAHLANTSGGAPLQAAMWGWRQDPRTSMWHEQGDRVGYWDEDANAVYLEPAAAFAVIQRLATENGQPIGEQQKTFWKRWKERGWIAESDKDRSTVRRTIVGRRNVNVIFVAAGLLSNEEPCAPRAPCAEEGEPQSPHESAHDVSAQ